MVDQGARSRFLAGRTWLRVVLGRYLDLTPDSIRFAVAERGKPSVVDGGDLAFSFSRSADVALVAVTQGRSIGVDVERIREVDHAPLAQRFFAPAELAWLGSLPELERRDAFFGLWVRKEAVVKASGAGLGDGLSHLDVRDALVDGRWSLAPLEAGPGYAAALAANGAIGTITLRDPHSAFASRQISTLR